MSVVVCAALKIHISIQTKEILDDFGTFEVELRGEIEMKVSFN
jgi:atrial natriuretic peptide receptor A